MSKFLNELNEKENNCLAEGVVGFLYKSMLYSIIASFEPKKTIENLVTSKTYKGFIFDETFIDELLLTVLVFSECKYMIPRFKESLLTLIQYYKEREDADIDLCNELIVMINKSSGENIDAFFDEEAMIRFKVSPNTKDLTVTGEVLCAAMMCDLYLVDSLLQYDERYIYTEAVNDDFKVASLFAIINDVKGIDELESFKNYADKILKKYSLSLSNFYIPSCIKLYFESKKYRKKLKRGNKSASD